MVINIRLCLTLHFTLFDCCTKVKAWLNSFSIYQYSFSSVIQLVLLLTSVRAHVMNLSCLVKSRVSGTRRVFWTVTHSVQSVENRTPSTPGYFVTTITVTSYFIYLYTFTVTTINVINYLIYLSFGTITVISCFIYLHNSWSSSSSLYIAHMKNNVNQWGVILKNKDYSIFRGNTHSCILIRWWF